MNRVRSSFIRIYTLSIILLISPVVFSQSIYWRDQVDKTFVFEINDREAKKLVQGDLSNQDALKMFGNPITEFSGKWENYPSKGHFVFATIHRNKVYYEYAPVMPFQVFLFKEYGILTLQVVDAEGNIRSDAKVRIPGKWKWFSTTIPFDKESKTYTLDDWSEETHRILTVELDKFTAVFDLEKHLVHPWNNHNDSPNHHPDFYSYMLTDKNKYKPGETVRFKSYALSGRKRPLKKELEVWMQDGNYRFKKIKTIEPYHPGGYAGEMLLHDSLGLRLDQTYSLQLKEPNGKIVANTSLKYEDYELYDSRLEVKMASSTHYFPDTNRIEIRAIDANGLLLQDVKADIYIKRRNVNQVYSNLLILPDTLLKKHMVLDNSETTIVDIPANLFGESDCSYEVDIRIVTFDNQILTYQNQVSFYRSNYFLYSHTRNDSIRFSFYELGKEKNNIQATLYYNDSTKGKTVSLPYVEPFNQSTKSYRVRLAERAYESTFNTRAFASQLDISGGIVADSFHIKLENPLNLDVSWYIYQGNLLLQKGAGKSFDFKLAHTDLDVAHYAEVFYFMGDEEQVYRRIFIPKTEFLSVDLNLPDRIYPGQQVDATITVKDSWLKPLKGVDLTAFAVNSLLNYQIPDLPYYGKAPQNREKRSSYSINKQTFSTSLDLKYPFWMKSASLDTMKYYQFTYPWYYMFTYQVNTPDSTTQFAPYVMKDGNPVDIHVIYQNGYPIYFSWTEQPKKYSFLGSDTAKQSISLRLANYVLVLDSMVFEKGKKTIISIDLDHLPKTVKKFDISSNISGDEAILYRSLTSRIPVHKKSFTYLKQGESVYPVYHPCLSANRGNILIGPFPQGTTTFLDSIEYKHEGGFSYQFDGNVVYKYPDQGSPSYLTFSSNNHFQTLNDFCLTPEAFSKAVFECQKEKKWAPRSIYISQHNMNLHFRLPEHADTSGISNLLFIQCDSQKVLFPNRLEYGERKYSEIPENVYDVILLYNSGRYLKFEKVPFQTFTYTEVNMSKLPLLEADSVSTQWLSLRAFEGVNTTLTSFVSHPNQSTISFFTQASAKQNVGNMVSGRVYDETGLGIPGVSVMLKGTTIGTITDMDGYFEIALSGPSQKLVFSFIGYVTKELEVEPGAELTVVLVEDNLTLDEVVVVGYGTARRSSLSGSIATVGDGEENNSQIPSEDFESDDDGDDSEGDDAEDRLYAELMQLNGLRSNFSDVGFWEPALVTNRKGQASFTVQFPDNITQWEAVVYAMNRRLKTGTFRKSIQSYKPLMAELKTPQFLVLGDSSYLSGNIRNYTKAPQILGNILFAYGTDTIMNQPIAFTSSHQDYLLIHPTVSDSLSSTYLFTRNDGYSDGEKRTIPVEPQGTQVAEGTLCILRNGEHIEASANGGEEVQIQITGKQLDVYMDAANYLIGYEYACNEQLASKLIGLLNYKIYKQYLGEPFEHDINIIQIIKRLTENQNEHKLWSWWGQSSQSSFWMSAHIMRALRMAKDAGYTVNIRLNSAAQDYMDMKPFRNSSLSDIEILHALSEWGTAQNYEPAIQFFENQIRSLERVEDSIAHANKTKRCHSYLKEKLLLWEIRQRMNLGYEPDSILHYCKKDVLGALYIDDGINRNWYADNLITTLIGYRIIRNDSTLSHLKEPMQLYILGTKQYGWNTYQASSALSTVFPDLFTGTVSKDKPTTVLISGKENRELNQFPYAIQLKEGEKLRIEKKEGIPLIYTAYAIKQVTKAYTGVAFEVSTYFVGGDTLQGGNATTLIAQVTVKQKNAEHVLIEIPIPAGCSYASKPNYRYGHEVHREYFKEKTVVFCEKLPEGTYYFNIPLLARYTGKYHLNPAKVEMMYFPVIHSNNDLRKVNIE